MYRYNISLNYIPNIKAELSFFILEIINLRCDIMRLAICRHYVSVNLIRKIIQFLINRTLSINSTILTNTVLIKQILNK